MHEAKQMQKTEGIEEGTTESQRSYITALAKKTGVVVHVEQLRSRQEASALIERLKSMPAGGSAPRPSSDDREKKVAFGMATKLVFGLYAQRGHTPMRESQQFWQDVKAFHAEYLKQQGEALLS